MVPHGRKFFLEARYSGCGSISISSRNMNHDPSQLPPDCPWTCSFDRTFFSALVIWGLVGPRRIFGGMGYYSHMNWFFLAGALEWKCLLMKLMMLFWIRGIGCIDGARVWFQVG